MMSNTTKKAIIAAIVQKTGVKPGEARRAVEAVLSSMKSALADGKKLDLGRLGVLSVVTRSPVRRISRNLKNVSPTIEPLHRRHPKTARHTKGQDLSYDPRPTIVHKRPEPPAKKSFAIDIPAWRRRIK
jgi:nucleoid DNA-binding protein